METKRLSDTRCPIRRCTSLSVCYSGMLVAAFILLGVVPDAALGIEMNDIESFEDDCLNQLKRFR